MNLRIEELRNNLYKIISESNLPVGVAFYVVKDLTMELEELFKNFCQKERMEKDGSDNES